MWALQTDQRIRKIPRLDDVALVHAKGGVPRRLDPSRAAAQPVFLYNPSLSSSGGVDEVMVRLDPFAYCHLGASTPLMRFPPHANLPSSSLYLRGGSLVAHLPCVEDPRPFLLRGQPYALFGRFPDRCGMPRSLGVRMWIRSLGSGHEVMLRWPQMTRGYQKNWLPFVVDDVLYVSYSLCPHIVLRCDEQSGACTEVYRSRLPGCYAKLRGGAAPVGVGHGLMLGVAHTTANFTTSMRGGRLFAVYSHHLYLQQATPPFELVHVSPPFRFASEFGSRLDNLQFCSGLAVDAQGRGVLSYGVGDCVARAMHFNLSDVLVTQS